MPENPDDAPAEAGAAEQAEPVTASDEAAAEVAPETREADGVAAEAPREAEQVPDARLLEAHDLALEALREITDPASIGAPAGHRVEGDGVVSLLFENTLRGYPGWYWTVSLAVVEGAEPTVLEAELLPGDGALLAPEWVPWAVRLKEYQAAQAAAAAEGGASGDERRGDAGDNDLDEDDLDEDDLDEDDLDEDDLDDDDLDEDDELHDDLDPDASPVLHAGDMDGVDIDELDEDADDSDEDSDDDDSDEASDEDDSDED